MGVVWPASVALSPEDRCAAELASKEMAGFMLWHRIAAGAYLPGRVLGLGTGRFSSSASVCTKELSVCEAGEGGCWQLPVARAVRRDHVHLRQPELPDNTRGYGARLPVCPTSSSAQGLVHTGRQHVRGIAGRLVQDVCHPRAR